MLMSPTPLAELAYVGFRYPGQAADVLHEVCFSIHAGEVVLLSGPNGCGKSTLIGLLSGRLAPCRGAVRVFGRNPRQASRAPDLGLVSEPFHPEQSPLPVDLSVRQVLTWLQILDGVGDGAIAEGRAYFQIADSLLDRPIRRLSKGERQRVMLLVAFLRRPRLLLADEPLEGLDRESQKIVSAGLRRHALETGGGVCWISHHLSDSLAYADRLLEIVDGTVVEPPPSRFSIRLIADGEPETTMQVASLRALPGIVSELLPTRQTLRLEIQQDGTDGGEP